MNRTASLVIAAFLTAPVGLPAQPPDTTSMRYALERLRESGSLSVASALLYRERGSLSAQERDALADSLVAIAVSYVPGESPTERSVARSAIATLSSSGHAGRAMPFPRAFEALVRIYENTSVEPFRASILPSMINLPDRGRVIEFMADAASDPEAVVSVEAVRQLANYLGAAGQARLRRLYEEDAVVNRTARGHLETIALHFGWGSGGSGG